jgi:hypothetical protein
MVTISGAILFGVSYIAITVYFEKFGVAPREVGISYFDLIVRQTCPAMVVAIAVPLITWTLVMPALNDRDVELAELEPMPGQPATGRSGKVIRQSRWLGGAVGAVTLLAAATYVAGLLVSATAGGREERHPGLFDPLRIDVPKAQLLRGAQSEVLVLGATEQHLVVYDVDEKATLFLRPDTEFEVLDD